MKETIKTLCLLGTIVVVFIGFCRFIDWRCEVISARYHVDMVPVMAGCGYDWSKLERRQ